MAEEAKYEEPEGWTGMSTSIKCSVSGTSATKTTTMSDGSQQVREIVETRDLS